MLLRKDAQPMRREPEYVCDGCGDEFDIFVYWSSHPNYCKAKRYSRRNRRVVDTELRHGLKLALIRDGLVYCFQVRRASDERLLSAHGIGEVSLLEIRDTPELGGRDRFGRLLV